MDIVKPMKAEDRIKPPDVADLEAATAKMNLQYKLLEQAETAYQATRTLYNQLADQAALAREHWRAVNNDRLKDDIAYCRQKVAQHAGATMIMRNDGKFVSWLNGYTEYEGRRYIMLSRETAGRGYSDNTWEYNGWIWHEVE
jgi:hypothetical protein